MKIFVKAKPKAGIEKVEKISENHYVVWVKEPPIKGLANKAIVRALSKYFDVSDVVIVSGLTSRTKVIDIYE